MADARRGSCDNVPFVWDARTGVEYAPPGVLGTNASITRDGRQLIVQTNQNGKSLGIDGWTGLPIITNSAGIWDTKTGKVADLGSLNGNTCFGGSQIGFSSSYGWSLDATAKTAVGTGYIDRNGDGSCEGGWSDTGGAGGGEIVPFIWTADKGMRQLSLQGIDLTHGALASRACDLRQRQGRARHQQLLEGVCLDRRRQADRPVQGDRRAWTAATR